LGNKKGKKGRPGGKPRQSIKPDAESVMSLLRETGYPMSVSNILLNSRAGREERATIKRLLKHLEEQGKIARERGNYVVAGGGGTVTGRVELKKDFGFLIVPGGEDIFLGREAVSDLLPGDIVEVIPRASMRGGREGILKRVKKRGRGPYMCVIKKIGDVCYATLMNRQNPLIRIEEPPESVKNNDMAIVELIESPPGRLNGRITASIGADEPVESYKLFILNKYSRHKEFPDEATQEAKLSADFRVPEGRLDLRNETVFTIDPYDAKDYDDAVSLSYDNGVFTLGVHIADVTFFLKEGTALDQEAFARGLSTYLPGEVLPMLPEELSNGACSLVEAKDRLTFSCIMKLGVKGDIISYEFKESVIRNKKRFTYEQVEEIIRGNSEAPDSKTGSAIMAMNDLKDILRQNLLKGGMVDFSLGEPVLELDGNNEVTDIKRKLGLDSHRLIEYFMIYANICAADFCVKHYGHGMYRIHPPPSEKDIFEFNNCLNAAGVSRYIKKPVNTEFQAVLKAISSNPKRAILEKKLLRAMQLARYSENCTGHFGLALERYSHFTSPIRRYADVLTHRLIKNAIGAETMKENDKQAMKSAAVNISELEESSEKAENEVFRLYALSFMKKKMGEVLPAFISKVTKSGLVCELEAWPVEGFVDFESIPGEVFIYDKEAERAIGRRTRKIYTVGDRLSVIIVKVTLETLKMDLEIEG